MLKIRLQRVGRKNDPSFRVVVTDSKRGPKSGDNIELLGSYNPRADKTQIKGDRVRHWMSVGAQVSDTMHNLLVNEKIIEGKKINVLPKKSPIKKEVAEEAPKEDVKAEEEVSKEETVSEMPAPGSKEEAPKAEGVKDGSEDPKKEESKEAAAKEETLVEESK